MVKMVNVQSHELSLIPLSLDKHGYEINTTLKAELIVVLMAGFHPSSEVPETDMKTCMLIDGHRLFQALGKPVCQPFGDYADVLMQNVTCHFEEYTTRVDVVFDRCILEDSEH